MRVMISLLRGMPTGSLESSDRLESPWRGRLVLRDPACYEQIGPATPTAGWLRRNGKKVGLFAAVATESGREVLRDDHGPSAL